MFNPEFRLETRLPAVIYFNSTVQVLSREDFERFCGVLEAVYSPRQACLFYGRSFTVEPEPIPLARLRTFYGSMDSSFTLLLPPKGGGF